MLIDLLHNENINQELWLTLPKTRRKQLIYLLDVLVTVW